jgi:hypothetical protein
MKNSYIFICETMETKINEIIDKINKTHDIFDADRLDSELRILDWILYQVCSNEIKNITCLTFHKRSFFSDYYSFTLLTLQIGK